MHNFVIVPSIQRVVTAAASTAIFCVGSGSLSVGLVRESVIGWVKIIQNKFHISYVPFFSVSQSKINP